MNAERDVVIRLRGIHNQFGRQVVHHDLDLDVYRGEILGVVGGSGTGKSVLLKTIVGLQTPQEGEIEVLGYDLRRGGEEARDKVDDRWGVMFQDGALFSSLTVRENVEVPLKHVPDLDPKTRAALADLKISMVGLSWSAGDKYPSELSGACASGQGWRVRWRSIPISFSSTSRRQGSIPSGLRPSTSLSMDLAGRWV